MEFKVFEDTYQIYKNGLIKKVRKFKDPKKCVPKRKVRLYDNHEIAILYYKGKARNHRVDHLVAEIFEVEKAKDTDFLIHKDGNKLNHNVDNLQWVNIPSYLSKKFGSQWKKIRNIDAEGTYYISKNGRVWGSSTEELLNVQNKDTRHPVISLGKHRAGYDIKGLVVEAFGDVSDLKQNDPLVIKKVKDEPPKTGVACPNISNAIVTPDGKVYHKGEGCYLAQVQDGNGYLTINCEGKRHAVHRLVASAYHPQIEGKNIVNHKDRNRMNNHESNLEWVTHSENMKDIYNRGQPGQKPVIRYIEYEHFIIYKVYQGVKAAAKETKLNSGSITGACQRRVRAAGYNWLYITQEEFESLSL